MSKNVVPLRATQQSRPLEPTGGGPHDPGMETRIAVLEEIAKSTKEVLSDLRADQRAMRGEIVAGFAELRKTQERDFRLAVGIAVTGLLALAGLMARGFKWL